MNESRGYQPTGEPADLSKVTPPQRSSPIAPSQTSGEGYRQLEQENAALHSIIQGQNALLDRARRFVEVIANAKTSDRLTYTLLASNPRAENGQPALKAVAEQWLKDYAPKDYVPLEDSPPAMPEC